MIVSQQQINLLECCAAVCPWQQPTSSCLLCASAASPSTVLKRHTVGPCSCQQHTPDVLISSTEALEVGRHRRGLGFLYCCC